MVQNMKENNAGSKRSVTYQGLTIGRYLTYASPSRRDSTYHLYHARETYRTTTKYNNESIDYFNILWDCPEGGSSNQGLGSGVH